MYEMKPVPKAATVYVRSKARPLQFFQMLAEVVAVRCANKKFLQVSDWPQLCLVKFAFLFRFNFVAAS